MERLTKRNSMGVAVLQIPDSCENCNDTIWTLHDLGNGNPIERLAHYEDLSEQGRLVELPCELELGQKWFYIGFNKPIEFEIVDFGGWNTDGLGAYGYGDFPNMSKLFFPFAYFGNYVFKTYDEAEQALAERRKSNG